MVTVPAGTAMNVRLTDGIDVDASKTGMTFKSLVDDPIMIGGAIVIPRGAPRRYRPFTSSSPGR